VTGIQAIRQYKLLEVREVFSFVLSFAWLNREFFLGLRKKKRV